MKFGKLILRKIIKIFATRCLILGLKCTKNRFRLGFRPRPLWGSLYSAPPDLLAGFGGPTSKGRGGEGLGRGREGERKEGKARGRRGGKGKGKERAMSTPQYLEEVYAYGGRLSWISVSFSLHVK